MIHCTIDKSHTCLDHFQAVLSPELVENEQRGITPQPIVGTVISEELERRSKSIFNINGPVLLSSQGRVRKTFLFSGIKGKESSGQ